MNRIRQTQLCMLFHACYIHISCDAREITLRHVCIFIFTSELMAADQNVIKFSTCSIAAVVVVGFYCRPYISMSLSRRNERCYQFVDAHTSRGIMS